MFVSLFFQSCVFDSYDEKLEVVNYTGQRIYFDFQFGFGIDSLPSDPPRQDIREMPNSTPWTDQEYESLSKYPNYYNYVKAHCPPCISYLEPGESESIGLTNIDWEDRVEFEGGLTLFVMKADSVESVDWGHFRKSNKNWTSISLTLDDLDESDWQIKLVKL